MSMNYFGSNQIGVFAAPTVQTSPTPSGPGGNAIVPVPATPNDWPKMLLAMGILAGGLWTLSQVGVDEQYTTWLAVFIVLGIVTYYETHGNKKFSQGIQDLLGAIK